MVRISPSSNPEKEENLVEYIKEMQTNGCDFAHMDVMDGKFVSNSCLNAELVSKVNQNSVIPLDVHLMVDNPSNHILNYINAGANIITIHLESYENITNLLKDVNLIRNTNHTLVGISIKPSTPISSLNDIIRLFDLVLVMSVEPGRSGQSFIESTLDKIKELKALINEKSPNTLIEVDGGVNLDNAKEIAKCGADILVMGNAYYKAENKKTIVDFVHNL